MMNVKVMIKNMQKTIFLSSHGSVCKMASSSLFNSTLSK